MSPKPTSQKRPPNSIRLYLLVITSLFSTQLLPAAQANPTRIATEALESPLGHLIMTRTRPGRSALEQLERAAGVRPLAAASTTERYSAVLSRLENPALADLRAQLNERMVWVESLQNSDDLGRVLRSDARPLSYESMSREQRLILEEVATRALPINPAFSAELESLPRLSSGRDITFIDETAGLGARRLRNEFLLPAREPEAIEAGLRSAHGAQAEGLVARARGKLREMETCLENRSRADTSAAQRRWWLQSFLISQGITVVGNIVGSKEVDWKTLPTDMLVNAVWSGISARLLFSSSKFSVQFIRMQGLGQARTGVDAVIYYVSPLKETNGMDNFTATVDRTEYNAAYNAISPIVTLPLQRVIQGLDCLYSGGKAYMLTTGLRYLQSTSTAMVYFRLRGDFVGNGSVLLGD